MLRFDVPIVAVSLLAAVASTAAAQGVVQLPSFQQFSYSGSVLVPDGGATSLGGVSRAASGSRHRGFSRAAGQTNGNAGASVHVNIIDLQEIDRQILGGTPKEFLSGQNSIASGVDRTEEGKSLVRYARRQYRSGDKYRAAYTYRMAIGMLDGRLRDLAIAEYRRLR